ncbi:AfsR/SARP family transcriptional regulator [Longispora albida]|uniref:AfsR/SARP family transcriptional regulator n=1 Tax=Longispora albida TaxID=203523 RepID=UPI00146A01AB|nr:BTAD domain-containing putative transcriptional regulator [Longispora albida]
MEFRILGTIEARLAGRQVELGKRFERCLLGLLLLELGNPMPAERLIELLWDAGPPAQARSSLQVQVSRLRRRLAAARAEEFGFRLETRGRAYVLEGDPARVDVFRFRSLYEQALATAEPAARVQLLGEAEALWRGPVFGEDGPGLRDRLGTGLEELWLAATEVRLDAELACGHHLTALTELTELAGRWPTRERFAELRVLALYRAGRRADALVACQQIRDALREDLGLDLGPDLARLQVLVLRDDPALELPAAPAPASGPGPDASAVVPAQLPAAIVDFVGRDFQLRRLDSLLGTATAVVISTISGTGGVGKTALAVHWARQAKDQFPDGQLHVNLHGYSSTSPVRPIEALGRLLRALGVPGERVPIDVEEASGLYRSLMAGRRMLVLLDNANHPEQVRPLLPGSEGSLTLITSRDRLAGLAARDGARLLNLDVLTLAESVELLAQLIGPERTAAEPEATAELAELCGRLPLALRIAGVYAADRAQGATGIADYVAEVRASDRLGALEVAGDDQVSVRIAFDHSYAALPGAAATLFRLLSLVPGPDFSLQAAAALLGGQPAEAEPVLGHLLAAHLVEPVADGRYAMHDLLRIYAEERAQPEETEPATARLLDWYLTNADAASRFLNPVVPRLLSGSECTIPVGFGSTAGALSWLDAERSSLVAAVRDAASLGHGRWAWLICDLLRGYFHARRNRVDWLEVSAAALAAAEAAGDEAGQAVALLNLGMAQASVNQPDLAIELLGKAVGLARSGWPDGLTTMLNSLGIVHRSAGQPVLAAECYTEALAIARAQGKPGLNSLANLATISLGLGRLEQAREQYVEVIEGFADRPQGAPALNNLGITLHLLGEYDESLFYLSKALVLFGQIGNQHDETEARVNLAALHRDAGRLVEAAEQIGLALKVTEASGDRIPLVNALNVLGTISLAQGSPGKAQAQHGRALEHAEAAAYPFGAMLARIGLADAGAPDAIEHAGRALAIARDSSYRLNEGMALTALAAAQQRQGQDPSEAAQQALAIHMETGYQLWAARTRAILSSSVSRH